jgi:hypothetical protein
MGENNSQPSHGRQAAAEEEEKARKRSKKWAQFLSAKELGRELVSL